MALKLYPQIQDRILCAAKLQKDGGQSATVMYEILLEQPAKVSITSGLDKPAPADRNEAGVRRGEA